MRHHEEVGNVKLSRTGLWRKSASGTGLAFDIFTGGNLLRPLVATTGTTGWSASYDVSIPDLAVGTLQCAAFSYTSGSRLTYFGTPNALTLRNTTTAITGVLSTTDANDMYLGGMEYAGVAPAQLPGDIVAVLVWDRVVSQIELQSIAANPWQLLQAPPRRIWVASASGATLISFSAHSFVFSRNTTQSRASAHSSASQLKAATKPEKLSLTTRATTKTLSKAIQATRMLAKTTSSLLSLKRSPQLIRATLILREASASLKRTTAAIRGS
jgi:hypothetical protein